MNRTTTLSLLAGTLALTACNAPQSGSTESVALGAVGSIAIPRAADRDTFFFGAGDALGQEVFVQYVASIRAQEFYATGANDFPSD